MKRIIRKLEEFTLTDEKLTDPNIHHHDILVATHQNKNYALKPVRDPQEAAEELIKYDLLEAMKVDVPEHFMVKDTLGQYYIATEIMLDAVELGCIISVIDQSTKSISPQNFAGRANERLEKRGLLHTTLTPTGESHRMLPIVGLYSNLFPFIFIRDRVPFGRRYPIGIARGGFTGKCEAWEATPTKIPPVAYYANMLVALRNDTIQGDVVRCYKIDPDGMFDDCTFGWVIREQNMLKTPDPTRSTKNAEDLYYLFDESTIAEKLDGLKRVLDLSPKTIAETIQQDWQYEGAVVTLLTSERKASIVSDLRTTQERFAYYHATLSETKKVAPPITASIATKNIPAIGKENIFTPTDRDCHALSCL